MRALVLDGGVKPTDDFAELNREQGGGFDRALENFAAACDADEDCVLREIGPTLEVYTSLVEEIAELGSFPTDDPERVLTPGELQLGVAAALYSKDAWPFLAEALYIAETEQDGTLLQVLGDNQAGREPDGTYTNQLEANLFIDCADDPQRPDADTQRTWRRRRRLDRCGSTISCVPARAASAWPRRSIRWCSVRPTVLRRSW